MNSDRSEVYSRLPSYLACLLLLAVALLSTAIRLEAAERTSLYEEGERAEKLVVRITNPVMEGAGVAIHIDDGRVYGITAKHVVYSGGRVLEDLQAEFRAWPGRAFDLEVARLAPGGGPDLAVFRADLRPLGISDSEIANGVPLDQLGNSSSLDPGSELFTVGHATAGAWLTPKQAVRFARAPDSQHFLFEYECERGHSGGGVFDRDWRLVGMMIEKEAPYCRALRIEPIFKILQGWKLSISLREPPERQRNLSKGQGLRVAVVGFDNRTGEPLPPDVGIVARDIISTFLTPIPGLRLLTRDRLDEVEAEMRRRGTIESASGTSIVGQLTDVDALVTGSIMVYDIERRNFEAFGTSAAKDTFRMSISLQVIDTHNGRVRFSKSYETSDTSTYTKATSAPRQPANRAPELLETLIGMAEGDLKSALTQISSGLETAGQLVQIPVVSDPAGADVLLNGVYMGKTPLQLQMTLGMHEIGLELAGYRSWKHRINVKPETSVEVSLIRR